MEKVLRKTNERVRVREHWRTCYNLQVWQFVLWKQSNLWEGQSLHSAEQTRTNRPGKTRAPFFYDRQNSFGACLTISSENDDASSFSPCLLFPWKNTFYMLWTCLSRFLPKFAELLSGAVGILSDFPGTCAKNLWLIEFTSKQKNIPQIHLILDSQAKELVHSKSVYFLAPSKWISIYGDQRTPYWPSLHIINQVIQAPTITRWLLCIHKSKIAR